MRTDNKDSVLELPRDVGKVASKALKLFHERYNRVLRRTDRLFMFLLPAQWLMAIAVSLWLSPTAWAGRDSTLHEHLLAAFFLGGAIVSLPVYLAWRRPTETSTRLTVACSQVLFSALFIHLTGGRIETHFHIFGSLAILAFYRDLWVLIPATIVVAADHFFRGMYWPESVYGVANPEWWRFLEHAGWVVFIDIFLILNCIHSYNDLVEICEVQTEYTDRLVGSMHDSVIIATSDGIISRANGAATTMLGYSEEELLGQPLGIILGEEDGDGDGDGEGDGDGDGEGMVDRLRIDGVLGQREKTYVTKNGDKIPVLFSGSAVRDSSGSVEALVFVAHDITQRRQAEKYLQGLLHASPVGLLVASQGGRIERVNPRLTHMFGYSEREILGQPIELLVPDRSQAIHEGQRKAFAIIEGQPVMASGREVIGRRKDGTEFAAHVSLSSTSLEGHPIVLAGVLDRTEYHEAEEARRRMENEIARASGMAEVATGVLHNVGNVVNSVNISAGIAQDGLRNTSLGILEDVIGLLDAHGADPATLQKFLTEDRRGKRLAESLNAIAKRVRQEHSDIDGELASLRDHVRHIIAIVTSQQAYARSMGVLEEVELGPFIEKAIALSGTSFSSKDIRVECSYGETSALRVEPHKLMQIVVNLLGNARHALAENDPGDRVIRVHAGLDGDDTIAISVADNGTGIAPENLARIFTHGFTTKVNGHGFGLHVSATAAIELGGKLTAKSEGLGTGATFLLTLPSQPAVAV